MNVSRRTKKGVLNPYEQHQQVHWLTSAGVKSSYAYEKALEVLELSIIQPDKAFYLSCDYHVPMMHGLISAQFINELRISPSFDKASFAREYLARWSGGSDDSWYKYDKLSRYRKLKNPEVRGINRGSGEQFYLLSTDVARLNDQTVVSVFHVYVRNNRYYASLVNLFVLGTKPETKPFSVQAMHLKELIRRYDPKEVVIDTNGLK